MPATVRMVTLWASKEEKERISKHPSVPFVVSTGGYNCTAWIQSRVLLPALSANDRLVVLVHPESHIIANSAFVTTYFFLYNLIKTRLVIKTRCCS